MPPTKPSTHEERTASDKLETVTVELRDESDAAVDEITRLVVVLGGQVKSRKGRNMTAEVPRGTDRDPTTRVAGFVAHLRGNPLVVGVDYDR